MEHSNIYHYRDDYYLDVVYDNQSCNEYLYNPKVGKRLFIRSVSKRQDIKKGLESYILQYEAM